MSNMRSPEEKEMILKDYLSGTGIMEIEKKYSVNNAVVYRWLKKYNEFGIEGLKSNTGKKVGGSKTLAKLREEKMKELNVIVNKIYGLNNEESEIIINSINEWEA